MEHVYHMFFFSKVVRNYENCIVWQSLSLMPWVWHCWTSDRKVMSCTDVVFVLQTENRTQWTSSQHINQTDEYWLLLKSEVKMMWSCGCSCWRRWTCGLRSCDMLSWVQTSAERSSVYRCTATLHCMYRTVSLKWCKSDRTYCRSALIDLSSERASWFLMTHQHS